MIMSWMNPKLFKSESDAYRDAMTATDPEILLVGKTRTTKTTTALRKVIGLHFLNYGFQSGIVRANAVDLHDSIREDIKWLSRYPLDDPRCPIKIEGGAQFHTLHINGGRCSLGGMNRPGRVLGTGKDLLMFSQADQSTDEHIQILKTRLMPRNWRYRDRLITQLLMECNPDRSDHHLLTRKKKGLTRFIDFDFTDNPYFYRNGRWSRPGKDYVEEQGRSLQGVYRQRFFEAEWADPEGAVFELLTHHIINELPVDIGNYLWYNAMDFGMTEPSVCLWIGEHAVTGNVIVALEFRHTAMDIIEFGHEVRRLRAERQSRILNTIIDNDENRQQLLVKRCGIPCQMARKGPGSVMDGINLIQNALHADKLQIYKGLRDGIRPDPKLIRDNKPLDLITEMRNLQYDEDKDQPIKGNDHAVDALRYWFLWRSERRQAASFASGATQRKSRV